MMVPYGHSQLAAFDPGKSPAGKLLKVWRDNEHTIVLVMLVGAGLFTVAAVFAAVKAAPLAMKAAPHVMKYAATKYPLLAAAV